MRDSLVSKKNLMQIWDVAKTRAQNASSDKGGTHERTRLKCVINLYLGDWLDSPGYTQPPKPFEEALAKI